MHLTTLVELLEEEIGVSEFERSKLADLLAERGGARAASRAKAEGRPAPEGAELEMRRPLGAE